MDEGNDCSNTLMPIKLSIPCPYLRESRMYLLTIVGSYPCTFHQVRCRACPLQIFGEIGNHQKFLNSSRATVAESIVTQYPIKL